MAIADKRLCIPPHLADYVAMQAEPPVPAQRRLIETTASLGGVAEMQIPHEQGVFLTLLAQTLRATTVVDIGTFTGYSALALARGLTPGGLVHTFDVSTEWHGIATTAWAEAGISDRIRQHGGPAATALRQLPGSTTIDLAFIDADKVSYVEYWELLLPRVRPGGVILADNVLYAGEVVQEFPSVNGLALKNFNDHVRADDRVESVLLTIADGITFARKKGGTR